MYVASNSNNRYTINLFGCLKPGLLGMCEDWGLGPAFASPCSMLCATGAKHVPEMPDVNKRGIFVQCLLLTLLVQWI